MLVEDVSRALEELAEIVARLKFVAAELQKANKAELKRRRNEEQSPDAGK